jgi:probable addiction module antidote protein
VLEEVDLEDIKTTFGPVAKACDMSKIAEEAGQSRPSLSKALSPGSKPQFDTILNILRAVGQKLNVPVT